MNGGRGRITRMEGEFVGTTEHGGDPSVLMGKQIDSLIEQSWDPHQ